MKAVMDMFNTFASSAPSSGFTQWAVSIMEKLGGPGAALLVALENLFPPLPSEVILPLAGFTASQGDMHLIGAIIWTTLGSLVGATILYYLGALLGRQRMRMIVQKIPLVKLSDVDKTEKWFAKHQSQTVFWGRMIPIFRSLISIPAGIEKMPLPKFLAFTAIGSLIWNSALILAGYFLGENWHIIEDYIGLLQIGVIIAVVLAIIWFIYKRLRKSRR